MNDTTTQPIHGAAPTIGQLLLAAVRVAVEDYERWPSEATAAVMAETRRRYVAYHESLEETV